MFQRGWNHHPGNVMCIYIYNIWYNSCLLVIFTYLRWIQMFPLNQEKLAPSITPQLGGGFPWSHSGWWSQALDLQGATAALHWQPFFFYFCISKCIQASSISIYIFVFLFFWKNFMHHHHAHYYHHQQHQASYQTSCTIAFSCMMHHHLHHHRHDIRYVMHHHALSCIIMHHHQQLQRPPPYHLHLSTVTFRQHFQL